MRQIDSRPGPSRPPVEAPVGLDRADEDHFGQRLAGQEADDGAVGVGDIERGRLRVLQALEHALDSLSRTHALDAGAHEGAEKEIERDVVRAASWQLTRRAPTWLLVAILLGAIWLAAKGH